MPDENKKVEYELLGEQRVLLRVIMEKKSEFTDPEPTNNCIIVYLSPDLDQQMRNKCCIVSDALIYARKTKEFEVNGEKLILTDFADVVALVD